MTRFARSLITQSLPLASLADPAPQAGEGVTLSACGVGCLSRSFGIPARLGGAVAAAALVASLCWGLAGAAAPSQARADDAALADAIPAVAAPGAEAFAGGAGTAEDPYQIATAAQLDLVRSDLAAHYVLVADIDLSGFGSWEPIGSFMPASDAPEDAEVPNLAFAFTGTFDGQGHTVSGLVVDAPDAMAVGLFGCAAGTEQNSARIENLVVADATVSGFYLVGAAVGLQGEHCVVSDVDVAGATVSGCQGVGGVVGTGFDLVEDCDATADVVVLGDGGGFAGVVVGGTTFGELTRCTAQGGSVTATGTACVSIGGLCGAPFAIAAITDCAVDGVTLTVDGAGSRLIGGLVGFTGTYGELAPTEVSGCSVGGVSIEASATATELGALIGGSYMESDMADGALAYTVEDCAASATIEVGA